MKNLTKHNVGLLDRVLRVFVGIALLTLAALAADGTFRVFFIILSIPLLFSGITGFCPTYTLFGIFTASPRSQMMSQMLHACCSAGEKFPSCPPMMKHDAERVNDHPWGTSGDAHGDSEGR
jgi:hypothetical protein